MYSALIPVCRRAPGPANPRKSAPPAAADPDGPTDYETIVVAVEPAAEGVTATVIGGDSFVMLTVTPGVSVDVIGNAAGELGNTSGVLTTTTGLGG